MKFDENSQEVRSDAGPLTSISIQQDGSTSHYVNRPGARDIFSFRLFRQNSLFTLESKFPRNTPATMKVDSDKLMRILVDSIPDAATSVLNIFIDTGHSDRDQININENCEVRYWSNWELLMTNNTNGNGMRD